jgi:hypothetical protein
MLKIVFPTYVHSKLRLKQDQRSSVGFTDILVLKMEHQLMYCRHS